MSHVWKLMKYTQGENDQKTCMKLIMPVYVDITTISDAESNEAASAEGGKLVEIKVRVSLPLEYQADGDQPGKEPPIPIEKDIEFEVIEQFKCYARYLANF